MDRESFDVYAMDNRYSYDEIEITDNINSLSYKRRDRGEQYYLFHNTKFPVGKFSSGHETSNVRLLPLCYKHFKNLGLRLNDTGEFKGAYVKEYIKGKTNLPKEEFTIYIKDDCLEISYRENYGVK